MKQVKDLLPIDRSVRGVGIDPDTGKVEHHKFAFVVKDENEFAPSLLALMKTCEKHNIPPKVFVEIASRLIFGDESEDHIAHVHVLVSVLLEVLGDDAF